MRLDQNQLRIVIAAIILLIPLFCIGVEETLRLNDQAAREKALMSLAKHSHFFDDFLTMPSEVRRNKLLELITLTTLLVLGWGTFAIFSIESKKEGKKKLPTFAIGGAYIALYTVFCLVIYKGWFFFSDYLW